MHKSTYLKATTQFLCIYLSLHLHPVCAESVRYAVEQSEFAIRSGKSYKNESIASIKSSEQVTVVEEDIASGWARVRTAGGSEGWIQIKYLTENPQTNRCPNSNTAEVGKLRAETQRLVAELNALRAATPTVTQSPPPTAIPCPTAAPQESSLPNAEQMKLETALAESRSEVTQLKKASIDLRTVQRNWFLGGALVTLLGALVGRLIAKTAWARD